jgi:hypothetical protein
MTGLGRTLKTGVCVLALCAAVAGSAEAKKPLKCAAPADVTAMQVAAIQQELMDAALTCGDSTRDNFNAFQTSFGPELRRSDKTLLSMFKRVMGSTKGDQAYNLFKTELAGKAELRRIHGHADFCTAAGQVFAAALAPEKPSLNDFVSGIPVTDIVAQGGGVDSCKVEVAVTLQGAMAGPVVVPRPNPLRVAALVPEPPKPAAPPPDAVPAAPPPAPPPKEVPKESKSGWLSGLWN